MIKLMFQRKCWSLSILDVPSNFRRDYVINIRHSTIKHKLLHSNVDLSNVGLWNKKSLHTSPHFYKSGNSSNGGTGGNMPSKCIFCRITNGEVAETELLYSDSEYVAFKDHRPVAEHHYLIVPKIHFGKVSTLKKENVPMIKTMEGIGKALLINRAKSEKVLEDALLGCLVTTTGNKLLEDDDTISPAKKRAERNSHDHNHHHGHGGHGHSSSDGGGGDLLEFFRQLGVRLTDGKDREGADDLGNDLDFLAPDLSPHHSESHAKMEELRQLFLSGGVPFGQIFAQLSGQGGSSRKSNTTEKPTTSTARLPIKHHLHWEDPPTDLIMKDKVAEPVFASSGISSTSTNKRVPLVSKLERKGKGLSMGGTIGGATTSKPEYLTETQYYSPSEFEDISREARRQKSILLLDPTNDNKERDQGRDNAAKTGDRRIDIDDLDRKKPSKNVTLESIFEQENDYYPDYYTEGDYNEYEGLLKDYYEGDYYEDSLTNDDSSIDEESEEESPEVTRTPRTSSENGENEQSERREVDVDESSRPLVGRRILSANPSHLHIEDPHEMDHMMMMMLRNAIAQVRMEEHLLDVQDGSSRRDTKHRNRGSKKVGKPNRKKPQPPRQTVPTTPQRHSFSRKPQTGSKTSFTPTRRPSIRPRRPKILNKPTISNSIQEQNLGQTLIPPESVRSGGDSVVDDYADYEYIYFYDMNDQDEQRDQVRQRKKQQQLQKEARRQSEERIRQEQQRLIQEKRAREEKRLREKEEREQRRKEEENRRQAQLRLRQQEQLQREQEKERIRLEEQERKLKIQQERQLQERGRLELSRRLEEEQRRLQQQQLGTLDNSKQNRQFAQRQKSLFRLQSVRPDQTQSLRPQFQRKKKTFNQERRRPKTLEAQGARFRNRPAPVSFDKTAQKELKLQEQNTFATPTVATLRSIISTSKIPRQRPARLRSKPISQLDSVLTTSRPQVVFTSTHRPSRPSLISNLQTPVPTRPPIRPKQISKRPRQRPKRPRRPSTFKQQRRPKQEGVIEPRIIPIANVKPPNTQSGSNISPVQKSNNRGKFSTKFSNQGSRSRNDLKTSQGQRKSKKIGINGRFNGRFESMFHKADNVPETSFTCSSQQFPGLYADTEADCQVFHMCHQNGHRSSFLCPSGTAFDQRFLVCNWSKKVECQNAPNLYQLNADLYKQPENS